MNVSDIRQTDRRTDGHLTTAYAARMHGIARQKELTFCGRSAIKSRLHSGRAYVIRFSAVMYITRSDTNIAFMIAEGLWFFDTILDPRSNGNALARASHQTGVARTAKNRF